MFDNGPQSESGCKEPDYEAQLARLIEEQKTVGDFLRATFKAVKQYGAYHLEKKSFMEVLASATIRQNSLPDEIFKVQEKIDNK